jgi:hypothetical protein
MRAEERLLLACCAAPATSSAGARIRSLAATGPPLRWTALVASAERHGVASLVERRLRDAAVPVPAAAAAELEASRLAAAALQARDRARLADAAGRLAAAGYEVMALKGTALALAAGAAAWPTVSRDLDLLLRPRAGAQLSEDERSVRRELYRRGVECDVGVHHDLDDGGALPFPFARLWERTTAVDVGGTPVLVPDGAGLLLGLCVNACRKRYLRPKTVADLALTLASPAAIDVARFAELARSARAGAIAWTALRMVRELAGAPFAPELLAAVRPGPARRLVIELALRLALRGSLAELGQAHDGRRRTLAPTLLLPLASYRSRQLARSWLASGRWRAHLRRRDPARAATT